jgi:glutathione S-transferase
VLSVGGGPTLGSVPGRVKPCSRHRSGPKGVKDIIMAEPILYGPDYSTYVRTARLAFEEKGVSYRLEQVDFLQAGMPDEQVRRHPFGKVPALTHDSFDLYETSAITRYIDEGFPGPALQPSTPRARARMMQIIAVLDSYTYVPAVWGIAVERLVKPKLGAATDENAVTAALPKARTALVALDDLAVDDGYLVEGGPSLADFHLAPIFAYLTMTPEAGELLAEAPKLARWWEQMRGRPSMAKTQPAG